MRRTSSCWWRCLSAVRFSVSLPSFLSFSHVFGRVSPNSLAILATLLARFENNDQVIMAKLKRISDFFYSVLCAFVIRDFNMVPHISSSFHFQCRNFPFWWNFSSLNGTWRKLGRDSSTLNNLFIQSQEWKKKKDESCADKDFGGFLLKLKGGKRFGKIF